MVFDSFSGSSLYAVEELRAGNVRGMKKSTKKKVRIAKKTVLILWVWAQTVLVFYLYMMTLK